MNVLEFTLNVLSVAGGWRPMMWMSLIKQIIYNLYTILLNTAIFVFIIIQILFAIFEAINANEVVESLYMAFVGMIANLKIITIRVNHQNLESIINNLSQEPFKPMEQDETIIQMKYEKMAKNNTVAYLILMGAALSYMTGATLLTDLVRREFPYNAWYPFDYSVSMLYYFLYIHQVISMNLCSFLNVACDCFFSGLLLQISCQIEILEHRLSKIENNRAKLRECVLHHYRIFEFAEVLNNKFVIVIGSQFIGACSIMCCLLFRLTVSTSTYMYIDTMMQIACALLAISYYCWFGNEVRLKSLDLSENIYNINWTDLSESTKKNFMIIMNRATSVPIKFTSARIVPLTLDSFVTFLKTTYSIVNLMRQTQEE